MVYGVVPICTDVGGMKDHIQNAVNGFLVENYKSEKQIIDEFVIHIENLLEFSKLEKMSDKSYIYAKEHFSQERFVDEYTELFKSFLHR